MFSNFSSSQSPLRAKRRKVGRACDHCRESRTRCEAVTPCPQCVANHVTCFRSSLRRRPPKSQKRQSSPVIADYHEEGTGQSEGYADNGLNGEAGTAQQAPQSISLPSARQTDSMLGFISRINNFCAGVSHLTSPTSTEEEPPPYTSPFPPVGLQDPADCSLTESQVSRLLLIFWTRLWPQVPIVRREDLRLHLDSPSPLRDAIIAYCMQYVYYSGLQSRILGLNLQQFQRDTESQGLPYFQRCLRSVTQYNNFSQPSVLTLQCYCFLIIYLLDASQHSAAYNMIGLALRIAESLKTDETLSGTTCEAQNLRRVWWTLNHLDFRCSRHLGKPVNVRSGSACPPQIIGPEILLYHAESMRLTAAALAIVQKFDCHTQNESVEACAHLLSDELYHLRQWESELSLHMQLHVGDTPDDPDEEPDVQESFLTQPPIDILLTTLLELQYHNVIVTLHRVFIQFPSHPLVPKRSPQGDKHNATALNHALAMIKLAYQRMTTHDILHGTPEIYQYIWNAVLTLVGFMLAYPYCYRCPRARRYARLALTIFDSAGAHNSYAVRSASLTRHLCAKVDHLIKMLNVDQSVSGSVNPLQIPILEALAAEDTPCLSSGLMQPDEGQILPDVDLSASADTLWSWADFMNVTAWPNYCDEVSEAFADPTKLSSI
ncbi:uncharacterized protein N7506_009885 [Penicillium brevicompactum]|uniref:uncharacterized protein n=1 Tax=Penicillium brevicompactum TaxID=5074 RepID=UPI00253F7AEE|nr:uncharacterized protein N7506_009885 [Penicillium brevicompactum]KAJ5326783.1 hypothetical protein N7506_009885 [Penicillium brevicompactum]